MCKFHLLKKQHFHNSEHVILSSGDVRRTLAVIKPHPSSINCKITFIFECNINQNQSNLKINQNPVNNRWTETRPALHFFFFDKNNKKSIINVKNVLE